MSGIAETIKEFGSFVKRTILGSRYPGEQIRAEIPITDTGFQQYPMLPNGFKPAWIIIHHSFSADEKTRDWDGIRKYHMSYRYHGEIISQGQFENYLKAGVLEGLEYPWKDIGYNFGIEDVDGKLQVMTGRRIGTVGAHCLGFNSRSIGICLIGNYDRVAPDTDRLFMLASLCRQLQIEFAIPRDQVIGHRESYGKLTPPKPVEKTCPGSKFDLDAFRARLRP